MPERYNRVLLKLSGEVFGGGGIGVDADVVSAKAREIAEIANSGVQVAVVVGGGTSSAGLNFSSTACSVIAPTIWECSAQS